MANFYGRDLVEAQGGIFSFPQRLRALPQRLRARRLQALAQAFEPQDVFTRQEAAFRFNDNFGARIARIIGELDPLAQHKLRQIATALGEEGLTVRDFLGMSPAARKRLIDRVTPTATPGRPTTPTAPTRAIGPVSAAAVAQPQLTPASATNIPTAPAVPTATPPAPVRGLQPRPVPGPPMIATPELSDSVVRHAVARLRTEGKPPLFDRLQETRLARRGIDDPVKVGSKQVGHRINVLIEAILDEEARARPAAYLNRISPVTSPEEREFISAFWFPPRIETEEEQEKFTQDALVKLQTHYTDIGALSGEDFITAPFRAWADAVRPITQPLREHVPYAGPSLAKVVEAAPLIAASGFFAPKFTALSVAGELAAGTATRAAGGDETLAGWMELLGSLGVPVGASALRGPAIRSATRFRTRLHGTPTGKLKVSAKMAEPLEDVKEVLQPGGIEKGKAAVVTQGLRASPSPALVVNVRESSPGQFTAKLVRGRGKGRVTWDEPVENLSTLSQVARPPDIMTAGDLEAAAAKPRGGAPVSIAANERELATVLRERTGQLRVEDPAKVGTVLGVKRGTVGAWGRLNRQLADTEAQVAAKRATLEATPGSIELDTDQAWVLLRQAFGEDDNIIKALRQAREGEAVIRLPNGSLVSASQAEFLLGKIPRTTGLRVRVEATTEGDAGWAVPENAIHATGTIDEELVSNLDAIRAPSSGEVYSIIGHPNELIRDAGTAERLAAGLPDSVIAERVGLARRLAQQMDVVERIAPGLGRALEYVHTLKPERTVIYNPSYGVGYIRASKKIAGRTHALVDMISVDTAALRNFSNEISDEAIAALARSEAGLVNVPASVNNVIIRPSGFTPAGAFEAAAVVDVPPQSTKLLLSGDLLARVRSATSGESLKSIVTKRNSVAGRVGAARARVEKVRVAPDLTERRRATRLRKAQESYEHNVAALRKALVDEATIRTYGDVPTDARITAAAREEIADLERQATALKGEMDGLLVETNETALRERAADLGLESAIARGDISRIGEINAAEIARRQLDLETLRMDLAEAKARAAKRKVQPAAPTRLDIRIASIERVLARAEAEGIDAPLFRPGGDADRWLNSFGVGHLAHSARSSVPFGERGSAGKFRRFLRGMWETITEQRSQDVLIFNDGLLRSADLVNTSTIGQIKENMFNVARAALKGKLGGRTALQQLLSQASIARDMDAATFIKKFANQAHQVSEKPGDQLLYKIAVSTRRVLDKHGANVAGGHLSTLLRSHFNVWMLFEEGGESLFPHMPRAVKKALLSERDNWRTFVRQWNDWAITEGIQSNIPRSIWKLVLDERSMAFMDAKLAARGAGSVLDNPDTVLVMERFTDWVTEHAPQLRQYVERLGEKGFPLTPDRLFASHFIAPTDDVFYARAHGVSRVLANRWTERFIERMSGAEKGLLKNMVNDFERGRPRQPSRSQLPNLSREEYDDLQVVWSSLVRPSAKLRAVGDLVDQVVRNKLILDMSFFTIQGFTALAARTLSNPAGVGTFIKAVGRAITDDAYWSHWLLTNAPELSLYHRHGLVSGLSSVAGGEFRHPFYLEKLPLLGPRVIRPFRTLLNDRAFERGLLYAKVAQVRNELDTMKMIRMLPEATQAEWARQVPFLGQLEKRLGQAVLNLHKASSEDVLRAVIAGVNDSFTGVRPAIGDLRQTWERILLLTPNYFRAQIKWHVKALQPWTVEGYVSSRILIKQYVFWGYMSWLLSLPSGEEHLFNYADPTRADWLAIRLPEGRSLPVMPARATANFLARTVRGALSGDVNALTQWTETYLEGRAAPLPRELKEQLTGEDFLGRKYNENWERAWSVAEELLPIWVENAADESLAAFVKRDPNIWTGDLLTSLRNIGANTALEFMGKGAIPGRPLEHLDRIAQEAVESGKISPQVTPSDRKIRWFDLPEPEREELLRDPNVQQWWERFEYMQRSRADSRERRRDETLNMMKQRAELTFGSGTAEVESVGATMTLSEAVHLFRTGTIDGSDMRAVIDQLWGQTRLLNDTAADQLLADGFDLDKRDDDERPQTLFGKALLEYQNVRVEEFTRSLFTTGGVVQVPDWDAYERARTTVLSRYDTDIRQKVLDESRRLEERFPILREQREAGDELDKFFTIPKYRGLTVDQSEKLDLYRQNIRRRVGIIRSRLPAFSTDISSDTLRRVVLGQMIRDGEVDSQGDVGLATLALSMENHTKVSQGLRNPVRVQWIIERPNVVLWYPFLLGEVPAISKRLLPGFLQEKWEEHTLRDVAEEEGLR